MQNSTPWARLIAANAFLPAQLQVVQRLWPVAKVTIADALTDCRQATDVVLNDTIALGLRWRSHSELARFDGQVTFRTQLDFQGKSEWFKVLDGYGDYSLYGFKADDGRAYAKWWLVDLNVLRDIRRETFMIAPYDVSHPPVPGDQESFLALTLSKYLYRWPTLVAASAEAGGWINH